MKNVPNRNVLRYGKYQPAPSTYFHSIDLKYSHTQTHEHSVRRPQSALDPQDYYTLNYIGPLFVSNTTCKRSKHIWLAFCLADNVPIDFCHREIIKTHICRCLCDRKKTNEPFSWICLYNWEEKKCLHIADIYNNSSIYMRVSNISIERHRIQFHFRWNFVLISIILCRVQIFESRAITG